MLAIEAFLQVAGGKHTEPGTVFQRDDVWLANVAVGVDAVAVFEVAKVSALGESRHG